MGTTPPAFRAVRLDEDEPEDLISSSQLKTPRASMSPFVDDPDSGVHPIGREVIERELGAKMWAAFSEKDYRGALGFAKELLAFNPKHTVATVCVEECRRNLIRDIELSSTAYVVGTPEAIRSAALQHREGFLLAQIDGLLTVDELLDVSGMDHGEALEVIAKLVTLGLVAVR